MKSNRTGCLSIVFSYTRTTGATNSRVHARESRSFSALRQTHLVTGKVDMTHDRFRKQTKAWICLQNGEIAELLLVTGRHPLALRHERGGLLINLGLGRGNLVLFYPLASGSANSNSFNFFFFIFFFILAFGSKV